MIVYEKSLHCKLQRSIPYLYILIAAKTQVHIIKKKKMLLDNLYQYVIVTIFDTVQ